MRKFTLLGEPNGALTSMCKTSGLLLGKRAMTAGSTLRCWATSERGAWVNQSDSETSSKRSLRNFQKHQISVAGVFDVVSKVPLDVADVNECL